jgi:hypothetical protein
VGRRTACRCRACSQGKQHIPCDSHAIRLGNTTRKEDNSGLCQKPERQP